MAQEFDNIKNNADKAGENKTPEQKKIDEKIKILSQKIVAGTMLTLEMLVNTITFTQVVKADELPKDKTNAPKKSVEISGEEMSYLVLQAQKAGLQITQNDLKSFTDSSYIGTEYRQEKVVSRKDLGIDVLVSDKNLKVFIEKIIKNPRLDNSETRQIIADWTNVGNGKLELYKKSGGNENNQEVIALLNNLIPNIPDENLKPKLLSDGVLGALALRDMSKSNPQFKGMDKFRTMNDIYRILCLIGDDTSDAKRFELKDFVKNDKNEIIKTEGLSYTYVPLTPKRIALIYDKLGIDLTTAYSGELSKINTQFDEYEANLKLSPGVKKGIKELKEDENKYYIQKASVAIELGVMGLEYLKTTQKLYDDASSEQKKEYLATIDSNQESKSKDPNFSKAFNKLTPAQKIKFQDYTKNGKQIDYNKEMKSVVASSIMVYKASKNILNYIKNGGNYADYTTNINESKDYSVAMGKMVEKDVLPLNTLATEKYNANQVDTDKLVNDIVESLKKRDEYAKKNADLDKKNADLDKKNADLDKKNADLDKIIAEIFANNRDGK